MRTHRDLLDPPGAVKRGAERATPPPVSRLDVAAALSLLSGPLAYLHALGYGFLGYGNESTVMGVVAFLLVGGAVAAFMHRLTRARIAIVLSNVAIIPMTLAAWTPPLVEAIQQGQGGRFLADAFPSLLIWFVMVGMAVAAGYLVLSSRD